MVLISDVCDVLGSGSALVPSLGKLGRILKVCPLFSPISFQSLHLISILPYSLWCHQHLCDWQVRTCTGHSSVKAEDGRATGAWGPSGGGCFGD